MNDREHTSRRRESRRSLFALTLCGALIMATLWGAYRYGEDVGRWWSERGDPRLVELSRAEVPQGVAIHLPQGYGYIFDAGDGHVMQLSIPRLPPAHDRLIAKYAAVLRDMDLETAAGGQFGPQVMGRLEEVLGEMAEAGIPVLATGGYTIQPPFPRGPQ